MRLGSLPWQDGPVASVKVIQSRATGHRGPGGSPASPCGEAAAPRGPSFTAGRSLEAPARPALLTVLPLPLPPLGSDSTRLEPQNRAEAAVVWPGGRRGPPGCNGGAVGPGASSASLPPWYTSRLSEAWMLWAQPMLAAAPPTRWRAAAKRSVNGQPGASRPPRPPCHRRLGGRAGGRRRAQVSRQEVRPPLLSRCGRSGCGGGEGAVGRAAHRGRPSEHALHDAGAAGRFPHIAVLASAAPRFRGIWGRRFELSQPESRRVRAARATPPSQWGGATPEGGELPAAPAHGPVPAPRRYSRRLSRLRHQRRSACRPANKCSWSEGWWQRKLA